MDLVLGWFDRSSKPVKLAMQIWLKESMFTRKGIQLCQKGYENDEGISIHITFIILH